MYLMKKNLSLVLLFLLSLTALGGCSSFIVKPNKVSNVKKMAIVGYRAELMLNDKPKAKTGIGKIAGDIKAAKDVKATISGEIQQQFRLQGEGTYNLLAQKLNERFGFEVVSLEEVQTNSGYEDVYKENVKSIGNSAITFNNQPKGETVLIDHVIPADVISRLSLKERDQIFESLGVDAMLSVQSRVTMEKGGVSVGGISTTLKHPEAALTLVLYAKGEEEPIWRDSYAKGEPAKIGVPDIGGVSVNQKLTDAIIQATENSIDKAFVRYKEKQAK